MFVCESQCPSEQLQPLLQQIGALHEQTLPLQQQCGPRVVQSSRASSKAAKMVARGPLGSGRPIVSSKDEIMAAENGKRPP